MAYAIASPDEICDTCGRPAERVVAAKSLCGYHFASLITGIHRSVRERMLTPRDLTPAGFTAWATLLAHGITIGVITDDEARHAWESAKDFAA